MEIGIVVAILVVLAATEIYAYYRARAAMHRQIEVRRQEAEAEIKKTMEDAEEQIKRKEQESRKTLQQEQQEAENITRKRRQELDHEEERLQRRRSSLDERIDKLEKREQTLNKQQSNLYRRRNEIEKLWEERKAELERVANLTQEEARNELLNTVEAETRTEIARRIRTVEEEYQLQAERHAQELLALTIQRLASDSVSEIAVSVVPLPSDEMKGRIIGRAGRNIRAFEQATGVDVIVDDTPEAVTLSSFDPIRREIARRAMSKLVLDGRIHPARIERLASETRKEVERVIREEGENAAYEANVPGLHVEILKTLGRLKFRSSYGQNQLVHAVETANLSGMIAAELGADVVIARTGGLLHDIGKALDHEIEGSHARIGAEFVRRYGIKGKVVNAIESHHHEVEQESVEAIIVEAADAISGARPGARRESLDTYIRRVKMLEEIAESFDGVEQSYALQAGREVRILVRPDEIDDLASIRLAREIASRIENTMEYPGQIKVTIIRETRAIDFAH